MGQEGLSAGLSIIYEFHTFHFYSRTPVVSNLSVFLFSTMLAHRLKAEKTNILLTSEYSGPECKVRNSCNQ
jgi:hypothetical protein